MEKQSERMSPTRARSGGGTLADTTVNSSEHRRRRRKRAAMLEIARACLLLLLVQTCAVRCLRIGCCCFERETDIPSSPSASATAQSGGAAMTHATGFTAEFALPDRSSLGSARRINLRGGNSAAATERRRRRTKETRLQDGLSAQRCMICSSHHSSRRWKQMRWHRPAAPMRQRQPPQQQSKGSSAKLFAFESPGVPHSRGRGTDHETKGIEGGSQARSLSLNCVQTAIAPSHISRFYFACI